MGGGNQSGGDCEPWRACTPSLILPHGESWGAETRVGVTVMRSGDTEASALKDQEARFSHVCWHGWFGPRRQRAEGELYLLWFGGP
jgi:hypothetical protein